MNTKLLKKHVETGLSAIKVQRLAADGSNAYDFYCADVVGNRKFAQNFGGWPRSDIAEINDTANLAQKMALLGALQEIPVSDANSGLSDAQIMLGHKSRYQQTPSEMQDWLVGQLSIRDAKRYMEEGAPSAAAEPTIAFEETENPSES